MTPNPRKVNEPADPDWITRTEAASIVGVSLATLDRYARSGKLPRYRTAGGLPRYRRADVLALLEPMAEDERSA